MHTVGIEGTQTKENEPGDPQKFSKRDGHRSKRNRVDIVIEQIRSLKEGIKKLDTQSRQRAKSSQMLMQPGFDLGD